MSIKVLNRIMAVVFVLLGALTVPIEWDITFFLFSLMVGIVMFFSNDSDV